MARLGRDAAVVLAIQTAAIPLGLFSTVIVARSLGTSGKGAYDLAMATAGVVATIGALALPGALTWVVARQPGLAGTLRWVGPVMGVAAGLIAVIVVLCLLPAIVPHGPWSIATAGLVGAMVAGMVALTCGRACMMGRLRIIPAAVLEGAVRLFTVLGFMVAMAISARVEWLLGVMAVTTILGATFTLGRAADPAHTGPVPWRTIALYSLPGLVATIVQTMASRADLFLLARWSASLEVVGIYGLAASCAQYLLMPASAVATALLPRAAADPDGRWSTVLTLTRLSSGITLLSFPLLWPLLTWVVPLVFGVAFTMAAGVCLALSPMIWASALIAILAAFQAGEGRVWQNVLVSSTTAVVALATMALLRFTIGVEPLSTVIIGMDAGAGAGLVVMLTIVHRHHRFSLVTLLVPTRADMARLVKALRTLIRRSE